MIRGQRADAIGWGRGCQRRRGRRTGITWAGVARGATMIGGQWHPEDLDELERYATALEATTESTPAWSAFTLSVIGANIQRAILELRAARADGFDPSSVRLSVRRYRDLAGRPTCAVVGGACQFLANGLDSEWCEYGNRVRIDRRGETGSLVPVWNCPLWDGVPR